MLYQRWGYGSQRWKGAAGRESIVVSLWFGFRSREEGGEISGDAVVL